MAKRTYRYFDGDPLYAFGYGLSYTTFAYSNPQVDRPEIPADGTVNVSVDVTNAGTIASDEVVELYLTHPGVAGAPLRALQGFQRVHLDRGQRKTVSFTLRGRDLSIVNASGQRQIVPGTVQVWIGGGQPGSTLPGVQTQFSVSSGATLPD